MTLDALTITRRRNRCQVGRRPRIRAPVISNHGNLTITNSRIQLQRDAPMAALVAASSTRACSPFATPPIAHNAADLGGGIFSIGSAYLVRVHVNQNAACGPLESCAVRFLG